MINKLLISIKQLELLKIYILDYLDSLDYQKKLINENKYNILKIKYNEKSYISRRRLEYNPVYKLAFKRIYLVY